ncbi:MAG: HAD family phosphatase [Blautia sp.]|nr:HAD family phosphatase [Blautia sp.]
MKPENIIFDVGGVLVGFRWHDMLTDYGMTDAQADVFGPKIFEDELWPELDRERIPYWDLVELYVKKYPEMEKDLRFFFTYTERMVVPRPQVWERVVRLHEAGFKLYLLSNYSSVMFEKHTGGAPFREVMDGGIVSYMVHEVKPEQNIYRHLFDKYSLDPAKCLFLDDREDNIQTGESLGMPGIVIRSEAHVCQVLDELLERA